jgi:transposase, IS5 family
MDRNYLKGEEGDKINAILAECGFNIRELLRAVLLWLFKERFRRVITNLIDRSRISGLQIHPV